MTVQQQIDDLIQEVAKTREIPAKIIGFHDDFLKGEFRRLGRSQVEEPLQRRTRLGYLLAMILNDAHRHDDPGNRRQ